MPSASYILDAEAVRDIIASMLTQGTGITLTYDDTANTLTISGSGTPSNMMTTDTNQTTSAGVVKVVRGCVVSGGASRSQVWSTFEAGGDCYQQGGTFYTAGTGLMSYNSSAELRFNSAEIQINAGTAGLLGNVALTPRSGYVVYSNGPFRAKHMTDAEAPNDSEYYSTDQSKRVYKDSSGTIHSYY